MPKIDWEDFEHLVASILQNQGWKVSVTSKGADGGIDVVGTSNLSGEKRKLFVQAKHYRSDNRVGRPELQQLLGASAAENVTDAILVSSSGFTQQAFEYATHKKVRGINHSLWGPEEIAKHVDELPLQFYEKITENMKKEWELTQNKSDEN